MYVTSFLRTGWEAIFSFSFSRNRPDDNATGRPVPPPLAYRCSHFLLTAPSSWTPLSAPPIHRQDSCCHLIPLLRSSLCSDGLNQPSDGTGSSSHRPPPPHTPSADCYSNSTAPSCLFFEFVHLSSLSGSSVHHPPCCGVLGLPPSIHTHTKESQSWKILLITKFQRKSLILQRLSFLFLTLVIRIVSLVPRQ